MIGFHQPYLEDRHRHLESEVRAQLAEAQLDHDPRRTVATLAELGLLRACVPARYGGMTDHVELRNLVLLRMLLGYTSSLADTMFAMQG